MDKFSDYINLQSDLVQAIDQSVYPIHNKLNLDWENGPPKSSANYLYDVLGKPDRMSRESGGVVIWENVDPYFRKANVFPRNIKSTQVYSKIMIKDEQIPHLVPGPHTDSMYAYMYMDIPSDKVKDVLDLTESVGYDTMKKEVYARCHFMAANLVSLYLCKQIANGQKSLAHAQQEYSVLIPVLSKESKNNQGVTEKQNVGPWHKTLTRYLFSLYDN